MSKQSTTRAEKIEKFVCLLLTMVIAVAITSETASACQPCKSKLDLEQSLKKADLVIVGKRSDYHPEEKRPSRIKVNVIKVLKGEMREAQVDVRSWYGMCPYGIVVDNRIYVMILKKSGKMPGLYTTVNTGCSVTKLLVTSNTVSIGGKSMSVEDIAGLINMSSETR